MPPTKGPLWKFYYQGEKQNSSQFKAYCKGCIQQKNYEDNQVQGLLTVPRYADILECGAADEEGNDGETPKSALVTSASAWCCELAKWVEEEKEADSEDDTDEPGGASTSGGRRVRPWLPCSLATLFTGESKQPPH
jgi:hypothetical protein